MHYMAHPGKALAEWMQARGLGENELARRSKVPQPTIHRILTAESQNPRRETLMKIARVFGRTAEDMYEEDARAQSDLRADRIFDDPDLTDDQVDAIRRLIEAFRK